VDSKQRFLSNQRRSIEAKKPNLLQRSLPKLKKEAIVQTIG